jgi:hypothetical protein
MRDRFLCFIVTLTVVLALSSVTLAQTAGPSGTTVAPAPARDLTGVWAFFGNKNVNPDDAQSPGGTVPPMTPWAQAKYDAEKPGYGHRAAPGGNDPILECDPFGFPRIMWFPGIFEFIPIPGRMLQLFERDHNVREIWTDGRSLPKKPQDQPLWYGYAIGKWQDDNTFVTETAGVDDRSWLGASGYPHSDEMRVEEHYKRLDHDTIQYDLTINDPIAYTAPWVGATRTLKIKPKGEVPQGYCVWTEENSFTQRIRMPAAKNTAHK